MKIKIGIATGTSAQGRKMAENFAGPKELVYLSQMAEKLGFDSVWGDDHITRTPSMEEDFRRPVSTPNYYELLISLACFAQATSRVYLGTGVIQTPLRDPVLLAKQASTLDNFSGGRFILGVGIGAHRDELVNLNPRLVKPHRGNMLDEALEVLSLLFTEDNVSFEGKYYEFKDVSINPKPLQNPFPIYLSGTTDEVPRRVARFGAGLLITRPSAAEIRKTCEEVSKALGAAGRDTAKIDVVCSASFSIAKTHQDAVDRYRNSRVEDLFKGNSHKIALMEMGYAGAGPRVRVKSEAIDEILGRELIGTPSEIIERMHEKAEAGATHFKLAPYAAKNFDEMVEQLQMFGEEVLPAFKSTSLRTAAADPNKNL